MSEPLSTASPTDEHPTRPLTDETRTHQPPSGMGRTEGKNQSSRTNHAATRRRQPRPSPVRKRLTAGELNYIELF